MNKKLVNLDWSMIYQAIKDFLIIVSVVGMIVITTCSYPGLRLEHKGFNVLLGSILFLFFIRILWDAVFVGGGHAPPY